MVIIMDMETGSCLHAGHEFPLAASGEQSSQATSATRHAPAAWMDEQHLREPQPLASWPQLQLGLQTYA